MGAKKISQFRMIRVALLNDQFRRSFKGGSVNVSPGVEALPEPVLFEVLNKVREFDDFRPCFDPREEHDFGVFAHNGERFLFQIDYYNQDMTARCEDPGDENAVRVLSVKKAMGY
ncbi:MAG: DUF3768 domain-containing protein [Gammaproteobacteria bacterium]|nr:DUF3768 domain-containing protein [Gammaproteobacteria bacterium]